MKLLTYGYHVYIYKYIYWYIQIFLILPDFPKFLHQSVMLRINAEIEQVLLNIN